MEGFSRVFKVLLDDRLIIARSQFSVLVLGVSRPSPTVPRTEKPVRACEPTSLRGMFLMLMFKNGGDTGRVGDGPGFSHQSHA